MLYQLHLRYTRASSKLSDILALRGFIIRPLCENTLSTGAELAGMKKILENTESENMTKNENENCRRNPWCWAKFTNLDWLILAQHRGFFLRILKPMSCFFFKTLHLQDRDQDQDLYAQDRDQDQDLYSRDRDQDQDIRIRSRDGLETRHCLETSHHWL